MIELADLRIGFAFTAGVATFFAPCAYPLLPGYLAFFLGHGDDDSDRSGELPYAVMVGGLASAGMLLVYGIFVGIVASVGTQILANIAILELAVGATLVVLGSIMAIGNHSFLSLRITLPERRRSPTSFLLFGIVYAIAAAGCSGPLFVGVALSALSGGPVATVLTLGAYVLGMVGLMIGITVLSAMGRGQLLRRLSGSATKLSRVAGALLVLAGVAQIYLFLFRYGGMRMLGL
ncbi:MAG: cytochrome c biogenesis CcdA family protein [Halobacteriales archaeon]